MLSRKDLICAGIGVSALLMGHAYLHFTGPVPGPINGRMGPNESPAVLYPTCDWFPDGVNGKPCVDNDQIVKNGRLVFYQHWNGPHRAN